MNFSTSSCDEGNKVPAPRFRNMPRRMSVGSSVPDPCHFDTDPDLRIRISDQLAPDPY